MDNAYSLQGQSHCSRSSSENSRDKNLRARTGTGLECIPGSHSKQSEASGRRFTTYSSGAYFGGEAFPQEIWVAGYKGTTEGKPLLQWVLIFKKNLINCQKITLNELNNNFASEYLEKLRIICIFVYIHIYTWLYVLLWNWT